MNHRTHEGGCLCGALRYRVNGEPFDADYCHCRMCQKSTGAPVGVWMDFKKEQVKWLSGNPREYASSGTVRRGFCAECGSTVSFRDTRYPEYYTLAIVTLDDPDVFQPEYHIHTSSRPKWFTIRDDLEKHAAGRGDRKT
jgi:hypothetical protein